LDLRSVVLVFTSILLGSGQAGSLSYLGQLARMSPLGCMVPALAHGKIANERQTGLYHRQRWFLVEVVAHSEGTGFHVLER